MKGYYYIGDNIVTTNPEDIERGVRILHVDSDGIILKYKNMDGPFESLSQLKKESLIYKKLAQTDTNRVQKILMERNIFKVKKHILTPVDKGVTKDFIKAIEHSIRGNIKSKNIYGIHFFDSKKMKIKKIINNEDENSVWTAIVEIFDLERKEWFEKQSTFFPLKWNLTKLFEECDYAFLNKVKDKNRQFVYKSLTLSSVPVEIIIRDNKLKSIYPIHKS